MTIKPVFVGINKHLDVAIPELSGARRDATAFAGAMGYGNIIGIADATRFHLRSAHQILATLFPDQPDLLKGLDDILQRLEFGLPLVALPLTKIAVRLTRGQCLALASIGVHTPDQLRALTNDRLRDCVGPATAALLRPVENSAAVGEREKNDPY